MKRITTINSKASAWILMLASLFTGLLFHGCEMEEEDGTPEVMYVRITDPEKSDSLVTHAFMGSTIAIIGSNLQNVDEIWFNDQKAFVNVSFVTSTTIIVSIPNVIPTEVTNQMVLITTNKKDTLVYPFGVDVPPPLVNSMLCEYVPDGVTAVIYGNFFINDPGSPLKVIFPGNLEGEVTSVSITEVKATVPDGAGVGPIQVKSIYGTTRSTFYFRDDRNIMLDFDVLTAAGGWRSGVIGNSNPDPINGNYVRFKGSLEGGIGASWNEDGFSFNLWPEANGRPDVPVYTGDLADAAIKFECYVVEEWKAAALQMIFTRYQVKGTNGYITDTSIPRGLWIPWKETGTYKTEGWITVTVPLSEFKYTHEGNPCSNPLTPDMISGLTFFVWNGGLQGTDCTPHICIDNIRVVPVR